LCGRDGILFAQDSIAIEVVLYSEAEKIALQLLVAIRTARWPATREIESYWYPVWLAYPAGMLEGSRLLDAPPHHVSAEETIKIGKQYEFLVLFTSTPGFGGDCKLAAAMKAANPGLKIAFVGPHVSTLPEQSLRDGRAIDFVIRREFDWAVVEFANGKPLQEIADGLKARAPAAPATHPRTSEKARPALEDEAIYLSGAGVILVHPFLEQLFCERDLLAGKSFRAIEARNRAVQMIGLVAFGRADVPEHELLLAKTLCDAALEEPLEPVLLEDKDVAACDALVRAVLQHWTALRSSSPEWLREQFFLRDGKLADVDSGRRLTIERRAQDVLLARLPWGFAVVALPWLRTQIFVHWLD